MVGLGLILVLIYSTGFTLTLICGILWMLIVNLLNVDLHYLKVIQAAIFWPITLTWLITFIYKLHKEFS